MDVALERKKHMNLTPQRKTNEIMHLYCNFSTEVELYRKEAVVELG